MLKEFRSRMAKDEQSEKLKIFFFKRKHKEKIFEDITAKNFPNLGKETDIQVQKAQRIATMINTKRTTSRHTVLNIVKIKDKERILKAEKEKQQVT